jgi:hypothetical protein
MWSIKPVVMTYGIHNECDNYLSKQLPGTHNLTSVQSRYLLFGQIHFRLLDNCLEETLFYGGEGTGYCVELGGIGFFEVWD